MLDRREPAAVCQLGEETTRGNKSERDRQTIPNGRAGEQVFYFSVHVYSYFIVFILSCGTYMLMVVEGCKLGPLLTQSIIINL